MSEFRYWPALQGETLEEAIGAFRVNQGIIRTFTSIEDILKFTPHHGAWLVLDGKILYKIDLT